MFHMRYTWFPVPSSPSNSLKITSGSSSVFTIPEKMTSRVGVELSATDSDGSTAKTSSLTSSRGRQCFKIVSVQSESLKTMRTGRNSSGEFSVNRSQAAGQSPAHTYQRKEGTAEELKKVLRAGHRPHLPGPRSRPSRYRALEHEAQLYLGQHAGGTRQGSPGQALRQKQSPATEVRSAIRRRYGMIRRRCKRCKPPSLIHAPFFFTSCSLNLQHRP